MSNKQKICVSVINDLVTDQRVHKVCTFLVKHNFDVLLIGRKLKDSPEINRDYKVKRFRMLFTKGPLFYFFFNLRLFFYLLFQKTDVLVANDLDTLLANYFASRIKGCKLVYDSHEYFTEVPELTGRPKVKWVWTKIENYLFPKLKYIYTVNQSIADVYSKQFKKKILVVRNVSNILDTSKLLSKEALNLPLDKKIIILQGAGINVDRGGEEAIFAMKFIENALLIIIGSGDSLPVLKKIVKQNNLDSKILFLGRMPYEKMMNYTFHADLGLSLDKKTNQNYRFSLPNKVFDYIHAQTPILASNVVEVAALLNKYQVGETIDDIQEEKLAERINQMLDDKNQLSSYKENCLKAIQELDWQEESKVLEKIYLAS